MIYRSVDTVTPGFIMGSDSTAATRNVFMILSVDCWTCKYN